MPTYEELGTQIGKLVTQKNKAYGDSIVKSASILKELFPNGIQPDKYSDMLLMVRIVDKLSRIANQKEAFEESPYTDIAGYGILGIYKDSETDKR